MGEVDEDSGVGIRFYGSSEKLQKRGREISRKSAMAEENSSEKRK